MEAIPVEEPARNLLAVATNHAETALLAGRTKVRELRAHQSSGLYLIEELETMVEELREVGSPSIRLIVTGKPRSLKSLVADELYSFVREAVTNAVRHSQGSEVLAEVQYTRMRLAVSVIDNGIGISSEMLSGPGKPGHWGLTGLRERSRNLGATMKIQSDQAGTRIILNVPGRRAFAQETSSKFQ
jgi:signal transduction histidine kinase